VTVVRLTVSKIDMSQLNRLQLDIIAIKMLMNLNEWPVLSEDCAVLSALGFIMKISRF